MTIEELTAALFERGYIADESTVTACFLALELGKPLLITGAPGVGKTEMAKVLASILDTELIRLQCYEGLDENKALYEWNYQKQLLRIQIFQQGREAVTANDLEEQLFSRDYLLERPLLRAISTERRSVLLIDEIDKSDEEFEAFLFELLSDFQVSIPELGTLTAKQIPVVVLTSNGERDLSDGLKRRCLFLYIDYPSIEKEMRIIQARIPGVEEALALQVARAVNRIRQVDLRKKPAIAETLDWVQALMALGARQVDAGVLQRSLNLLIKDKEDWDQFMHGELLQEVSTWARKVEG